MHAGESVTSRDPIRRRLVLGGLLLLAAFVVVAGGAYPRYNRVVYGAPRRTSRTRRTARDRQRAGRSAG